MNYRPNHERVLYTKLLRFREEQLENYDGPAMDYSMSDYHHSQAPQQAPRRSSTRVSLQASHTGRRQSQYSLLDPNRLPARKSMSQSVNRRSSVAETEESYDPYRPSRNQIAKPHADHMRVTVLRGASQQSSGRQSARVASRSSARNPSTTIREDGKDVYSIASSPPTTRMHSAGTSQLQRLAVSRRISRGSSRMTMTSRHSAGSSSSIVVARKSTSYKRNVSFVHNRRRSLNSQCPRLRSQEHHPSPLTLHERFSIDQTWDPDQTSQDGTEDKYLPRRSAVSQFSLEETPEPEDLTVIRSRKIPKDRSRDSSAKVRLGSRHFKDEARKVSTEMEKLCDEAFNRLPMSSSAITPSNTESGNRTSANTYQTYQSSTTSFSVHEDLMPVRTTRSNKSKVVSSRYDDRPLPEPPAIERSMGTEHLGSYTQRELAKTKELLKRRAAEADMAPGYLDEIIAHLDRLMQPSNIRINEEERRAVSTPDPNTGIERKDTFDEILEKNNIGFRSASEPVKKDKSSRAKTVRLVDSPSNLLPISPVKPLTIRKKSESSTPSSGSPRQITPKERLVTTEELYRQQAEQRRSAGLAPLENLSLDPIEEDVDKENFDPADRSQHAYLGEHKKRKWFHRRSPVLPPPPPSKDRRASPLWGASQDVDGQKRKSDAPSQESQNSSEPKTSGKNRFLKIFSGKRSNKGSQPNASGDYDLDDNESLATDDSTWMYNQSQTYMSGALPNNSRANIPNRGSRGSKDDKLMPPPPVPRAIQPQHQNWLARFLRIKPAINVMCFCVSKVRARKEVAATFREWRKYGMRDIVVDKVNARIWARVDVKNCKLISPHASTPAVHNVFFLVSTANTLFSPPHSLALSCSGIPHRSPPRPPRQPGSRTLYTGEGSEIEFRACYGSFGAGTERERTRD